MKRALLLLAVLMSGCAQHEGVQRASVAPAASPDGPSTAAALTAAYNDTRRDCGTVNRPAFLCSGVLFRATTPSPTHSYRSWNPKPGAQWVSFSYLRIDANYDHLAVGLKNGFVFFPLSNAPQGTIALTVRCSYPIDGNSWARSNGCDDTPSLFPGVSRQCQNQGITTAAQWKAHFNTGPTGADRERLIYSYVCGFDVRLGQVNNADAFYQTLLAMPLVPADLGHHYNELVLTAWGQYEDPSPLPIQAFFYVEGGLNGARHDQWEYWWRTPGNLRMPIIKMTLPANASGRATFTFNEADQYCKLGVVCY